MALTTASTNPPEPKRGDTEARHEAKADTKAASVPPAVLQSSDPAIQKLLAERQTAVMNREALQPTDEASVKRLDADIKAADEQIAEIDKKIADFGKPEKKDDEE